MTYTLKYSLQAFCTEHLTPVSGIPPFQCLEYPYNRYWNIPTTDTGISHRRYWLLVPFSTHYRLQITVSEKGKTISNLKSQFSESKHIKYRIFYVYILLYI